MHARISSNLEATFQFMSGLCAPDTLTGGAFLLITFIDCKTSKRHYVSGEGGYYLTVLGAAIEYIYYFELPTT